MESSIPRARLFHPRPVQPRNCHNFQITYIEIVTELLEILGKCASFNITGGWRNGSACLSYHFYIENGIKTRLRVRVPCYSLFFASASLYCNAVGSSR